MGGERLYGDGRFLASPEECETYGRDPLTGGALDETDYRALNPEGRAILKAAEYVPPHEPSTEEHPLLLTTGRTLYRDRDGGDRNRAANEHGENVDAETSDGLLGRACEKASELAGRRPEAGLLLLRDLRELHLLYAEASIDWVLLNQGAQAIRDAELVAAVADCHAQTLRGMKWTVTRLKTAAPQVLAG